MFKRWIQRRRIKRELCPYCKLPWKSVSIFDGEGWRPSRVCPDLHFGIMYNLGYENMDRLHINYRVLDNCGGRIPIPEQNIRVPDSEHDFIGIGEGLY